MLLSQIREDAQIAPQGGSTAASPLLPAAKPHRFYLLIDRGDGPSVEIIGRWESFAAAVAAHTDAATRSIRIAHLVECPACASA